MEFNFEDARSQGNPLHFDEGQDVYLEGETAVIIITGICGIRCRAAAGGITRANAVVFPNALGREVAKPETRNRCLT